MIKLKHRKRKNYKKLRLLSCLLLLVSLLGSWKSNETISARIYAFMDYYERSNPTEKKHGFGHSFIEFYNNTSNAITVGYYTLPAKETVTVGLWNAGVGGGSSSGSSGSSGSGSSASINTHAGVYYNREEYYYNYVEEMYDACKYETTITSDSLAKVTSILKEKK